MIHQVHNISFPISEPHALERDETYFILKENGSRTQVRCHDYDRPGLAERFFHQRLRCASPRKARDLLEKVLQDNRADPSELRVLDLGAGNGTRGGAIDQASRCS